MDLPISSLFWDLVLNKEPTLQDISRINRSLHKTLEELKDLSI